MKAKKWQIAVIISGAVALCLICLWFGAAAFFDQGFGFTQGRLWKSDQGTYLVTDNSLIHLSDRSRKRDLFTSLSNGDTVIILHGGIAESYPAQAGAYYALRLKSGNKDTLPDDFGVSLLPQSFEEPSVDAQAIRAEMDHGSIGFILPAGWSYDIQQDEQIVVSVWPDGYQEEPLLIQCLTAFGVCGTGLTEQTIQLGQYTAHKGTWGSKKAWDYIALAQVPGHYVIVNPGVSWWSAFEDEAMAMLETLEVAEGILSYEEAVSLARTNADPSLTQVDAWFDVTDGIWKVVLYEKGHYNTKNTFWIRVDGTLLSQDDIPKN